MVQDGLVLAMGLQRAKWLLLESYSVLIQLTPYIVSDSVTPGTAGSSVLHYLPEFAQIHAL